MSEALQELSTSQSQAIPEATKKLSELEFLSKVNSNQVLDDEIVMEEIESAIKRIKRSKRAGRDNICTEHLLYGGELFKVWVFNAIIFLEVAWRPAWLIKPIYIQG